MRDLRQSIYVGVLRISPTGAYWRETIRLLIPGMRLDVSGFQQLKDAQKNPQRGQAVQVFQMPDRVHAERRPSLSRDDPTSVSSAEKPLYEKVR